MKSMKKILALTLTLCMVLSVMVVPTGAAFAPSFSVENATGEAGKTVDVNVKLSGNDVDGVAAVTLRVYYKKSELTCTKFVAAGVWSQYMTDNLVAATLDSKTINSRLTTEDTENLSAERAADGWSMAAFSMVTEYKDVKFTGNGTIATLTFTVNGEMESADVPLEIEVVEGNVTNAANVKVDASGTNGKITVKGVTPTISTVTLDKTTVQVNGTAGGTVKATAKSAKGTDITSNVTWTVTPANKGVTVAANGTVTIGPKAEGGTYTVQAAAKTGASQGAAKSQTFSVTRATPVATKVEIASTPAATIAKPVGDAAAKEVTYTAKVLDQYDSEMTGQNIEWSNDSTLVNVTVANNKVTVPANAATGSFKLTATCGAKSAFITVKVVDIEFTGADKAITASGTYGQKWSEIVKIDTTKLTAKVGTETVTGTYSVVDANTVPAAGEQTYSVVFNNDTYKNIPVVTDAKVNVAKKAITVVAENKTRPYGNANPELTWTVTGLVGTDTKAALTVNLTTTATATTAVGDVAITGTGAADNYTITVTPGKLTITPVKVTAIAGMETALNLSKAQVTAASDLKALGLAEKVTLTLSDNVAAAEVNATYDKDLAAIKAVANTVTDAQDQKVEVTLTNKCFPAYAVAGDKLTMPKTTITITNKYPIPAADITVADTTVTFGDTYADPTATMADKAEYAGVKFTYAYTDKDGKAVNGKPVNAGEYTVTVTAENDSYKGSQTAKLTIEPKDISGATVTLPADVTYTYNKKPHTPVVTVKIAAADAQDSAREASGGGVGGATAKPETSMVTLVLNTDYTVAYTNNVNAGTATVTATGKGNYGGTASATFEIAKASLAELKPTILGAAQAGKVLSASLKDVANEELVWSWTVGETAVADNATTAYTVSALDSNKAITVKAAAAENGNYTGETLVSEAVTVAKVTVTGSVTVAETNKDGGTEGKIEVGDILTATATVTPDVTVTYQWFNNGKAIEDATQATYTVAEGDGKLTVTVTPGEDFAGSLTSAAVEVGKSVLTGTVAVTAAADPVAVDTELTVAVTSDATADDYTIVWLRDGVAIPGATADKYTVTKADQGKTITVKITAKGDSYTGELVSEALSVPAAAPEAPVVTASTGGQTVTLNWRAPAENGAPILGYTVAITAPAEAAQSVTVNAATTSYTFEGLTNDTEYTFTVTVNSAAGNTASEAVKATPKVTYSGGGGGGSISTSNTKTETLSDGTKVTTTTFVGGGSKENIVRPNGTKGDMNYNKDGSGSGTITMKDGTKAAVTVAKDGAVTAKVTVPAKVDGSNVTIPDKNAKPGTVAVIVKGDGTEEVVRMSTVDEVGVMVKLTDSANIKLVDNAKGFVDIDGHWAKGNVDFVSAREMFNGTDETHFTPDGTMTRGMVATVLFRLDGQNKGDATASFADVAEGTWYTDAVAWANAKGIVTGYDDTAFGPNDNVTREQLAVMIYRYAKALGLVKATNTDLPFADAASVNEWAAEAVSWLSANGILIGKPGNVVDPSGNATRAEVSAVLERFVEFAVK